MFIAALFTIARTWKQPECPSTEEWIKKTGYMYTMEYRLCLLSGVHVFVTPWTVAHQTPLSMEFFRHEYWSGLPLPPPGDLPNTRIEFTSSVALELAGGFFTTCATWEAYNVILFSHKKEQSNATCSNMDGPRDSHTE